MNTRDCITYTHTVPLCPHCGEPVDNATLNYDTQSKDEDGTPYSIGYSLGVVSMVLCAVIFNSPRLSHPWSLVIGILPVVVASIIVTVLDW